MPRQMCLAVVVSELGWWPGIRTILTAVRCVDVFPPLIQNAVVPSETYYIQIDRWDGTIGGSGQLEITVCFTDSEIEFVFGDSKNGVDKKARGEFWTARRVNTTKCVDPLKGLKPKEDQWLVGCGCSTNNDEPNPPQYCIPPDYGTKAAPNATKKPHLENKTPPP
jgi:hypothetical protein